MKTEKKRNLKGSVLFTVVAVLALMIIFMTSALALAAAANRRAHKSYSASQASYTARAAIDSILAAVGTDNEFAEAVANITKGGSLDVDIGINEPSLGKISNAKITYAGVKQLYDPSSKQWVTKNILEISCDVTLNGETTSIKSHIIQDPVVKTDDGPGYLTMGGKAFNSNGGTVLGGAYINMGYGKNDTPWNDADSFTYIKVNEDETITLEDHKYWSDQIIHQDIQNCFEAPMMINGHYKTDSNGEGVDIGYFYTQKGKGVTIWGDLYASKKGMYFEMSDNMKSALGGSPKFTDIPFLYVDGVANFPASNLRLGYQRELSNNYVYPFNVFAGSIVMGGQNATPTDKNCGASLYMMDYNGKSVIDMNNGPTFRTWVESVYAGNDNVGYSQSGAINSMGDVELGSSGAGSRFLIGGDVRVEGNLDIKGNIEMTNGIIACGGTLNFGNKDFKSATKTIYAKNVTGQGVTAQSGGGLKPGYTKGDQYYVRAKNFKYVYFDSVENKNKEWEVKGDDFGWLLPGALDAYSHTNVADESVDFGGALIDSQYIDGKMTDPDTADHKKVYKTGVYFDPSGNVVSEADAVNSAGGWTYQGNNGTIEIKPISEFYKKYHQTIYPTYARREVLIGVSGPIKGTEGYIAKGSVPGDVNNKTYNQSSLVGDVTESCTITGKFTKSVNIVTQGVGKDINVLIKDANFVQNARINVDEKNGGKVHFYFEGENTCEYTDTSDDSSLKLVDSVKDLMEKWGIEANCQSPEAGAFDKSIYSDSSTSGEGYEVDGDTIKIEGNTLFTGGSGTLNVSKNIEVYPEANKTIWIGLNNVTLGSDRDIIIHDMKDGSQIEGSVNFYFTNNVTLSKVKILTDSFLQAYNSNSDYQVVTNYNDKSLHVDMQMPKITDSKGKEIPNPKFVPYLPAPRVNIYSPTAKNSADKATLTIQNGAFFCAYVRAPRMTVSCNAFYDTYNNFLQQHVYYDGIKIGDYGTQGYKQGKTPQRFMAVGCFNVEDFPSDNDWCCVYVKQTGEGGSTITAADGSHTYAAVDYINY